MSDLTNEELDALERRVREDTEEHGPTWEAELSHVPPDGLEEWWIHTPWAGEGPDASCSQIALSMWEGPARLAADARNALPSLLTEVRRRRALESESATLRRELAEARAEVELTTTERDRAIDCANRWEKRCTEATALAEKAAAALSEARKESAGLREALGVIAAKDCLVQCAGGWMPCPDVHTRNPEMWCATCTARAALSASPRETAPAAAPHNPQSEEG